MAQIFFRILSLLLAICLAPLAADAASGPPSKAATKPRPSCDSLIGTDLVAIGGPGSSVVSAVESGNGIQRNCVVEVHLAPAITAHVSLPVTSWTGRFVQIGCGGLCGRIPDEIGAADGCAFVSRNGLVIAATDMGHQGMDASFGKDVQKRQDFAYRAVHLTALTAKALIRAYYGVAPHHSYFTGCSDGGREALMEAERFPEDFNGIIAGAPAMNFLDQNVIFHGWQAKANTGPDGKAILLASRLPILHRFVVSECDGLDGLRDGLIGNPFACHPELAEITCKAGNTDTSKCLTPEEIAVVRKFYEGPHDPQSGIALTPGGPLPGSELNWAGVYVPQSADQPIFSAMIASGVHDNLAFGLSQTVEPFNAISTPIDQALFEKLRPLHPFYDATNSDLTDFHRLGGKVLLWHGLADPHISPMVSIEYFNGVKRRFGARRTAAFARLFLFPGMSHCSGGEGPSRIDLLTQMINWVEQGRAPQVIIASQTVGDKAEAFGQPMGVPPAPDADAKKEKPHSRNGRVVRSRPVYPFPQIAHYFGKGDANRAENHGFSGQTAPVDSPAWIGSNLFGPYRFTEE